MPQYITTDEMHSRLAEVNRTLLEEVSGANIEPTEDVEHLRTREKVRIASDEIGQAQRQIYDTAHTCEEIVTEGICGKRLPVDLLRKLKWIKEQKAALKTAIQALGTGMPDDEIFHDYYKWILSDGDPVPEEDPIIPLPTPPGGDPDFTRVPMDFSASWRVVYEINAHGLETWDGSTYDLTEIVEKVLHDYVKPIFDGDDRYGTYSMGLTTNHNIAVGETRVYYTYERYVNGEWEEVETSYTGTVVLSTSSVLAFGNHPAVDPASDSNIRNVVITSCEVYRYNYGRGPVGDPLASFSCSLPYNTQQAQWGLEYIHTPDYTGNIITLKLYNGSSLVYTFDMYSDNSKIEPLTNYLRNSSNISLFYPGLRPSQYFPIVCPMLRLHVAGTNGGDSFDVWGYRDAAIWQAAGIQVSEGVPLIGTEVDGLTIYDDGDFVNKSNHIFSYKVDFLQYENFAGVGATVDRVYAVVYPDGSTPEEVEIPFTAGTIDYYSPLDGTIHIPVVFIYSEFYMNVIESISCNIIKGASNVITPTFVGDMTNERVSAWRTPYTPEADSKTRTTQEAETEAESQTGQPASDAVTKILAYAVSKIGTPYPPTAEQNAGNRFGPTYYDCSGLVYKAVQAGGINIPTVSCEQYGYYKHRNAIFTNKANVRPGDVIFWSKTTAGARKDGYGNVNYIHHVGLVYSVSGSTVLIIDSGSKGVQKRNLWEGGGYTITGYAHPEG